MDRAQKWLDIHSMSQVFSRHRCRYSIFKMVDDKSKMNTSLEKPQDRWSCRYTFVVSLITSAIIRGVVVIVRTGIGKTIRSKSAANGARFWDQKYRFLLCVCPNPDRGELLKKIEELENGNKKKNW